VELASEGSVHNLRAPAARSRTRTRRLPEPVSPLARGAPPAYVFMRPGARASSIVPAKQLNAALSVVRPLHEGELS